MQPVNASNPNRSSFLAHLKVPVPKRGFSTTPLNSVAALLHWRVLLVLGSFLPEGSQDVLPRGTQGILPQHTLLGQGTPEAVPHPEALDPCAPDPGQGTRDRIPETRKPPAGTIPSDAHPSSVGSSQQKVPLASPGGENMDPPSGLNPCHRNVVSSLLPWLGVVEKMADQCPHDRGHRKHWQTPSPAPRHERKLTMAAPLKLRPPEGVGLTQESQAAQVPETETGTAPVVDCQTHQHRAQRTTPCTAISGSKPGPSPLPAPPTGHCGRL